jgi:hypothetical protein
MLTMDDIDFLSVDTGESECIGYPGYTGTRSPLDLLTHSPVPAASHPFFFSTQVPESPGFQAFSSDFQSIPPIRIPSFSSSEIYGVQLPESPQFSAFGNEDYSQCENDIGGFEVPDSPQFGVLSNGFPSQSPYSTLLPSLSSTEKNEIYEFQASDLTHFNASSWQVPEVLVNEEEKSDAPGSSLEEESKAIRSRKVHNNKKQVRLNFQMVMGSLMQLCQDSDKLEKYREQEKKMYKKHKFPKKLGERIHKDRLFYSTHVRPILEELGLEQPWAENSVPKEVSWDLRAVVRYLNECSTEEAELLRRILSSR